MGPVLRAVRHAAGRAIPAGLHCGGLVQDGLPTPLVGPGEPVAAVYVDNGAVVGMNRADTLAGYERCLDAFARWPGGGRQGGTFQAGHVGGPGL